MATSHTGKCLNVPTTTSPYSPRNRRGVNHSDQDKFPGRGSSERLHPHAQARNASTSTTWNPQPLQGSAHYQKHHGECPSRRNHQWKWPFGPSGVDESNPQSCYYPSHWQSQKGMKTWSRGNVLQGLKKMNREERESQNCKYRNKEDLERASRNLKWRWSRIKHPLHLKKEANSSVTGGS